MPTVEEWEEEHQDEIICAVHFLISEETYIADAGIVPVYVIEHGYMVMGLCQSCMDRFDSDPIKN